MASGNSFSDLEAHIMKVAKALDEKMPDLIATAVMAEVAAAHKHRIFDQGLRADGTPIGNYSTKPSYYTKGQFVRGNAFKPQGKGEGGGTVAGAKKNGKPRKSMFLPGGYSEFRDVQGRQTKFVNNKLSGSLERAFQVVKFGEAVVYGTTNKIDSDKMNGLEEKQGRTFPLSEDERQLTRDSIGKYSTIVAKEA